MNVSQLGLLPSIYTLKRGDLTATVCAHGARLLDLRFKGQPMVLSYSQAQHWLDDIYAVNAVCGRVANRIGGASFRLNGKRYALSQNLGEHCLHGGAKNFSNQSWTLAQQSTTSCRFEIHSADGDQGFPGAVIAQVSYELTKDDTLTIKLSARTDSITPIDLTHHAYFCLNQSDCRTLRLWLEADEVLEKDGDLPSGERIALDTLRVDRSHNLGQHIERWKQAGWMDSGGFDHYFPSPEQNQQGAKLRLAAKLQSDSVCMALSTDQPGIFLYTAGHLNGQFTPFAGVCLEAQGFPNAVNQPRFPSTLVKPEQAYERTIAIKFDSLVDESSA